MPDRDLNHGSIFLQLAWLARNYPLGQRSCPACLSGSPVYPEPLSRFGRAAFPLGLQGLHKVSEAEVWASAQHQVFRWHCQATGLPAYTHAAACTLASVWISIGWLLPARKGLACNCPPYAFHLP